MNFYRNSLVVMILGALVGLQLHSTLPFHRALSLLARTVINTW